MKPGHDTPDMFNASDTFGLSDFFEVTPMSLWLEDYSAVYELFQGWRAQGVTDLREWLLDDKTRLAECARVIHLVRVNRQTLTMYGASSFDELSARLHDVFRDDMLEGYIGELEQLWVGDEGFQSSSVNYALDGRRMDISLKAVVLPDHVRRWDRVLVAVEDVTGLQDAQRQTQLSEQLAREFFEQAPVSLWVEDFSQVRKLLAEVRERGITDFRTFIDVHQDFVAQCLAEIRVLSVNRHTLKMYKAHSAAELLAGLDDMFRGEMLNSFSEQLIDLWEGRLFQQREVINYAMNGDQLHIHMQFSVFEGYEDTWGMVLLAMTDITARKKAEAYLEYLGKHDVLTQLKNRSFYVDEVNRLERKRISPVGIIALDLNHLKQTNDLQGHAAGDGLLRRLGEVLSKAIDRPAHASRIGGDEFMVLLPGSDEVEVQGVLENIHQLIELNNQFYGEPPLSVSMGMAIHAQPGRLDDALHAADTRMYEAKRKYHGLRRSTDVPTQDVAADSDQSGVDGRA